MAEHEVPLGLSPALDRAVRRIDPTLPAFSPSGAGIDAPVEAWAKSGAMWLSGRPAGPPTLAPGTPALAVEAALAILQSVGGEAALPDSAVLSERAESLSLKRRGATSCGGGSRLLGTADGYIALSLPRPDDMALLPALLSTRDATPDDLAAWLLDQASEHASERAQQLGIAAATLPIGPNVADAQTLHRGGLLGAHPILTEWGGSRTSAPRPLVVDLSSLWAGPLCSHLLGKLGARVVKVESTHRTDGARHGSQSFYDLLHGGHESVLLDLHSAAGVAQLKRLLGQADVVIEASRPRALAQWGIDPAEYVIEGTIWIAITAYGRTGPWANRVGFGDDIAVAAGMVAYDGEEPCFLGDALADPMTGVFAAVTGVAALRQSRGLLIDLSMRDVVASTLGHLVDHEVVRDMAEGWVVRTGSGDEYRVQRPRRRRTRQSAPPPGRDNSRWLG